MFVTLHRSIDEGLLHINLKSRRPIGVHLPGDHPHVSDYEVNVEGRIEEHMAYDAPDGSPYFVCEIAGRSLEITVTTSGTRDEDDDGLRVLLACLGKVRGKRVFWRTKSMRRSWQGSYYRTFSRRFYWAGKRTQKRLCELLVFEIAWTGDAFEQHGH